MPRLPSVESTSDGDLLGAFVNEGSEMALGALIGRYSGLVVSTAERVTGCANLAGDAAGITFAILARKAGRLCDCDCLGRWLHRTATYEAAKIARREGRHRRKLVALAKSAPRSHTSTSHMATTLDEPVWQEMVPHLDRAIEKLSAKDRQLIIDRFYRDHSLKDIARRLEVGEAAIQKRSQRAIRKLEGILRKRGVTSATASVLVSGMSLQFSNPVMASLTNASLTHVAIHGASNLSLGTLLSHTFTTMSTMKSAATCGAVALTLACIPLGWQRLLIAKEGRALEMLEATNVQLRTQADMPAVKGQVAKLQGIAGMLRRAHPSGGRASAIDLLRTAEDMDKMQEGDLIAAARALRLKKEIMAMSSEEFRALIERVPKLDLSDKKRYDLVDFLTMEQEDQYPAAVLEALKAILPQERGPTHHSIVGSMRTMLTHLARKDPDAAQEWLKTVEAEGVFELPATAHRGPYDGDPLLEMRGSLFKGMLDYGETAALAFYHSLEQLERGKLLRQTLLPGHEALEIRLGRELSDVRSQVGILARVTSRKMQEQNSGLTQDIFQFIDGLDLSADLVKRVAVDTARDYVQTAFGRDQGSSVPMKEGLAWLSGNLPKEQQMLAQGELVGHASMYNPNATEGLEMLFEETASDSLIEGYLRSSILIQRDSRAAFNWVARMHDIGTRQKMLMELAQQWHPQARDQLKAAMSESDLDAGDIDAVMASMEVPAP